MKSKSAEQVNQEMAKVFDHIKSKLPEAELIDSVIKDADAQIALKGDDIACWYLAKSIEMLSGADIVFFVNDWENARGCKLEREIARAYNKFCIEIKI